MPHIFRTVFCLAAALVSASFAVAQHSPAQTPSAQPSSTHGNKTSATTAQANKYPADKYFIHSEMPNFEIIRDDLPSLECNDVIQDSDGFIWVATNNGVARYDGQQTFSFGTGNDTRTQNSKIVRLADDAQSGYVWGLYANANKLLCIDRKNYTTREVSYDDLGDDSVSKRLVGLTSVCDSLLMGFTTRGFYTINKRNGHTQQVYKCAPRPNLTNRHAFFKHRGRLHNVSGGRLYTIDLHKSGFFDVRQISDDKKGLILSACHFNDSLLLMTVLQKSQNLNLITYNTQTGGRQFLTNVYEFNHELCIADDGVWLSTPKGLTFIRYSDKQTFRYTTSNSNLPDNKLTSIVKTSQQPIFFISSADGLIKMNYFSSIFTYTDMRRYSQSEFSQVWSSLKDSRGCTWIGTSDGIYHRRASDLYFSNIKRVYDKAQRHFLVMGIKESAEHDAVYFYTRLGVYRTNHDHTHLETLLEDTKYKIYNMIPLPGHKLLLALGDGVMMLDCKTHKKTFIYKPQKAKHPPILIHTDDNETLWLSDDETSLKRMNLNTLEVTEECSLEPGNGIISGLRHNTSGGMNELWFYTSRGALFYKVAGYPTVKRIREGNLLNYAVKAIEIDNNGDAWAATETGLVHLHSNDIREFTHKDYTICRKFTIGASSRGPNGEIIMGGEYGFIEFHPDVLCTNTFYPAPRLSSYMFSNSHSKNYDLLTQAPYVYNGDSITVPAGIRSLQMNMCVLSYDRPNTNKLEWRLDSEKEWKRASSKTPIRLYNLTEGCHNLFVRSLNNNDVPQADVTTLYITKELFFYETRAFYWVLALAGVLLIIGIFVWRDRQFSTMRDYLSSELSVKNDMLLVANKEMKDKQEIITNQNHELALMNNHLEELVAKRTQELEEERHKAVESNELKSAFLANLGHEVRTPMNAIMGFAKLLQCPENSEEERDEFVHLIIESGNNMLSLIGSLLDISRIERGIIEVSLTDFDVYKEISDTWNILKMEKRNKNVKFELEEDDELKDLMLCSDKDRFRQVIINLTYNAFKFTPSGHVRIVAKKIEPQDLPLYDYQPLSGAPLPTAPQGLLLLYVEDTGIGIEPDKKKEVFEPFRRIMSNKKHYGGLGLGLNIVKNLVQLMGGEVWLTSDLGIGSTFYFYLPFGLAKKTKESPVAGGKLS